MDKAILKGMFAAMAAVVSLVLAGVGFALRLKLGITTPGVLAWEVLLPTGKSIGGGIAMQLAIDFAFWFALMWALYWLLRRLRQRAGKSS
jgi:hypothetical protein